MQPSTILALKTEAALPSDLSQSSIFPNLALINFQLFGSIGNFSFTNSLLASPNAIDVPTLNPGVCDECYILGHRLIIDGSDSIVYDIGATAAAVNTSHTVTYDP